RFRFITTSCPVQRHSPLSVRFASCLRQDKISLRPPKCLACSALGVLRLCSEQSELAPLWESLGCAANKVSWLRSGSPWAVQRTKGAGPALGDLRLRRVLCERAPVWESLGSATNDGSRMRARSARAEAGTRGS